MTRFRMGFIMKGKCKCKVSVGVIMELREVKRGQNVICQVDKGSIADKKNIQIGDVLLSVNGQEINDIIEYKYMISDENITIAIQKLDGQIEQIRIKKEYDQNLGLYFNNPLIDEAKSCKNKCMFCFIDQLPKGMRETLYFKDDDSRLSFLQGNFITLTNMSDEDIERVIKYRISPINISVHTTNPELRVRMLKNPRAGKLYEIMKRFAEARIEMNCQIVLIPGVNDGQELERTVRELYELSPSVSSVAAVPVGLTKHRAHLPHLDIYDQQSSLKVIEDVRKMQQLYREKCESRFIFLSDEFYLVAGEPLPEYDDYEDFPQIENGVGLMRTLFDEVEYQLGEIEEKTSAEQSFYMVTGTLAKNSIEYLADIIKEKIEVDLEVHAVKNEFFGETITVAGLLTGQDIVNHLLEFPRKDAIIIPRAMLRSEDIVFLDNLTIYDLEEKLGMQVYIVENDGVNLLDLILEPKN